MACFKVNGLSERKVYSGTQKNVIELVVCFSSLLRAFKVFLISFKINCKNSLAVKLYVFIH